MVKDTTPPTKIVIIGRGNAAISFQATLLNEIAQKLPNQKVQITFISREDFCIRPELFFKFKFLLNRNSAFATNVGRGDTFGAEIINGEVINLNAEKKEIIFNDFTTNQGGSITYDICILAVGGVPNWIHFKENIVENDVESKLFKNLPFDTRNVTHYAKEHMQDFQNMTVLRNTEEIELLEKWILHGLSIVENTLKEERNSPQNELINDNIPSYNANNAERSSQSETIYEREIVVVGSGALALDFVSNLVHGFMKRDSDFEHVILPKITIISRGDSLGMSLLGDEHASNHLKQRISQSPIESYISILYNDEVETLNVITQDNGKIIDSLQLSSGKTVKPLILIQAVGVNPNTALCINSGLEIGLKGGIKVNEKFACESKKFLIPRNSLFAIGDAIEFPCQTPYSLDSAVWKNWTSSREQGELCAKYSILPALIDQEPESSTMQLVFSQTLRLFDLYVCCHGTYKNDSNLESDYIFSSDGSSFAKLQYFPVWKDDEQVNYQLCGAVILGCKPNHFQIGNNLLQLIKYKCTFTADIRKQITLSFETFNYSHCVKVVRTDPNITDVPAVVTKKFTNPLLRKKKKPTKHEQNDSVDSKIAETVVEMKNLSLD